MYISNVKITNYRGIKNDSFEASPFSCIIGENNAGKSSLLLASSLFFSGTSLSASDYYDVDEPILFEITFSNVSEEDIRRLAIEHRERIKEIISGGEMVLTRLYPTEGKSELLCSRLSPKDPRFNKNLIGELLKGKKGKEISSSMISIFAEYQTNFEKVNTQKDAYSIIDAIIEELPSHEKELKLTSLPTGIENSISKLLPEPIYIAAVKDLKDDVKSKETATFGKLLSILMKFLENSIHFVEISASFDNLHSLLNVVRTADSMSDTRIEKLKKIESQIGTFLQENFPKSKIEIDIPKPELKQIFSNAKILIDDGVRDVIETKGDGIKRAVTFALLRTYVEQLKEQKREHAKTKEAEEPVNPAEESENNLINEQPYLFLFEEPELYLHPNAQKILFEALENLTSESNQVFVTTHSPMFFSPQSTGTFVKVVKEYPVGGKPFAKLLTINLLKHLQAKDAFQIICYENNTAAFFSNKVLLVEGDSDLIYLKEVSRLLNNEWNFDNKNIPIISINGKSNVKRFIDFYKFFQIQCICVVDSDALIDGFEKFDVPEIIKDERSKLLEIIDKIGNDRLLTAALPSSKIKELARRYTWKERYNKLKTIGEKMLSGTKPTPEEVIELSMLFEEETNNIRRQIFTNKEIIITEKNILLQKLRDLNIFILSHGAIESYYPEKITGEDKPTKALNAINFLKEQDDCRNHLPTISIDGVQVCELELLYQRVFQD